MYRDGAAILSADRAQESQSFVSVERRGGNHPLFDRRRPGEGQPTDPAIGTRVGRVVGCIQGWTTNHVQAAARNRFLPWHTFLRGRRRLYSAAAYGPCFALSDRGCIPLWSWDGKYQNSGP